MFPGRLAVVCVIGVLLPCGLAAADVFNMPAGQTSLQFVTVGDPGNAADPLTGFGSVAYTYQMGEFDVTVAQYTQFLNSVAKTDSFGLWNPSMTPESAFGSCGISRSGTSGNYTYSFAPANQNFPVDEATWGDAARFANWLSNGQPDTGVENAATTESGSYLLNGAVTDQQLDAVTRSPFATYVIPSENEWYKAAYSKGGNAGYWLYPTKSDSPPNNVLSLTGTNNANYDNGTFTDPINVLTSVGAFADSPAPWGTFDQGGDISQWTEGIGSSGRVIRGGDFSSPSGGLLSTTRDSHPASANDAGIRIA